MLSDKQIIKRVLKGHCAEFRELVDQHQAGVFRIAYRILGRREDAEDITQEAFMQAYTHLSDYRGKGAFAAWLRRIAVNLSLKRIPRELPSDEVSAAIDAGSTDNDPVQDQVLEALEREDIDLMIRALPDKYRAVIVLRYQEDLSCSEIADMTGETVKMVHLHLHRARRMLAQRMVVKNNEA